MKINVKRPYITGSNNQLYKDVYKIVIRSYLIKSFRFIICISGIVQLFNLIYLINPTELLCLGVGQCT